MVEITASAGDWGSALGAFSLFASNVLAMIVAGVIVFTLYGYYRQAQEAPGFRKRVAYAVVTSAGVLILVLVTCRIRPRFPWAFYGNIRRSGRILLVGRLFSAAQNWSIWHLDTRSFLSRTDTTLTVVEADGGVAGWVCGHELAHPDGERTMLLYALYVVEQHRGRVTAQFSSGPSFAMQDRRGASQLRYLERLKTRADLEVLGRDDMWR